MTDPTPPSTHNPPIQPCPFCGDTWIMVQNDWDNPQAAKLSTTRLCYLACVHCKAYGPDMPTRQQAIEAWNRRTP